jgi:hypothetical protein
LTDKEDAEERPHSEEDSREILSHVNEYDEKLKEEDRRTILIIGGVEIFLPSN